MLKSSLSPWHSFVSTYMRIIQLCTSYGFRDGRLSAPTTPHTFLVVSGSVAGYLLCSTTERRNCVRVDHPFAHGIVLILNLQLPFSFVSRTFSSVQIAVMGDQSCGKSSVLEALSGVQFPRGSGLVTRCPVQLIMKRTKPGDGWHGKDTPLVRSSLHCHAGGLSRTVVGLSVALS